MAMGPVLISSNGRFDMYRMPDGSIQAIQSGQPPPVGGISNIPYTPPSAPGQVPEMTMPPDDLSGPAPYETNDPRDYRKDIPGETPADQAGVEIASGKAVPPPTPDVLSKSTAKGPPVQKPKWGNVTETEAGDQAELERLNAETNAAIESGGETAKKEAQVGLEYARGQQELMGQAQQERQAFQQAKERAITGADQQIQQAEKAFMDYKVDPDRFWHEKSTEQSIATGIGLILGAIGAGLAKQDQNQVMVFINQAIDRDIKAQMLEQEKLGQGVNFKTNAYARALNFWQDKDLALKETQLQARQALDAKFNVKIAELGPDKVNDAIKLAKLQNQKEMTNIRMGIHDRAVAVRFQSEALDLQRMAINKRGGGGGRGKPQIAGQAINCRPGGGKKGTTIPQVIKDVNGNDVGMVQDPTEYRRVTKDVQGLRVTKDAIDNTIAAYNKCPEEIRALNSWAWDKINVDRNRSECVRAFSARVLALQATYRKEVSGTAVSDQEREQLNRIIVDGNVWKGNPTPKLEEFKQVQIEKANSIIEQTRVIPCQEYLDQQKAATGQGAAADAETGYNAYKVATGKNITPEEYLKNKETYDRETIDNIFTNGPTPPDEGRPATGSSSSSASSAGGM